MPRYLRYLRIAFSAVCGIACVLLVVLWVRSYSGIQVWHLSRNHGVLASNGTIFIDESWVQTNQIAPRDPQADEYSWNWGPNYIYKPAGTGITLRYWMPIALAGMLTVLPWVFGLRWRFSLRTLLIATTLIAVVLGIIVWMTRAG